MKITRITIKNSIFDIAFDSFDFKISSIHIVSNRILMKISKISHVCESESNLYLYFIIVQVPLEWMMKNKRIVL